MYKVYCDFDETVTVRDVGSQILAQYGTRIASEIWSDFDSGVKSAAECLEIACESVTGMNAEGFARIVEAQQLKPGFVEFADYCRANSIELHIDSDGFSCYIREILAHNELAHIPFWTNSIELKKDGTLSHEFPNQREGCDRCASCKCALLLTTSDDSDTIVYIGDGYSDWCPAMMADVVFRVPRSQTAVWRAWHSASSVRRFYRSASYSFELFDRTPEISPRASAPAEEGINNYRVIRVASGVYSRCYTVLIKMIIIPRIFEQFSELIAAQSTRIGGVSPEPLGMNLSSHVGDEQANVDENRRRFFEAIDVPNGTKTVYQHQIHSANINIVNGNESIIKDSDALITGEPNVLLGVTVADCTPILLYEPKAKLIAAGHAGWRGTEQMIALAAVRKMIELGGSSENIFAFIGASASGEKYEVGLEVATLFEEKNLVDLHNGKFLLDVKAANLDQLLFAGVPSDQIEVSPLCTISDDRLHSYRRDGKRSGRMLAIIERKDKS